MPLRVSHPHVPVRALALAAALFCLGAIAASAAPAAAAPTTVFVANGSTAALNGGGLSTISDPSATSGSAVKFAWSGTAQMTVTLPSDTDALTLRARGDQCLGAPAYTVSVDGAQIASDTIANTTWSLRTYPASMVAGTHTIAVTFTNPQGQWWPACNRTLYLDNATFTTSGLLPATPAIPAGFVHQSGTTLLDGAGNPLRLHGVNLGGYLLWEGWIWGEGFDYIGESAMMNNLTSLVGAAQAQQFQSNIYSNFVTASDFHAMAVDRFNLVRVGFDYRLLEDDSQPFVYKQSGWAVLDRVINEAKQANVYVMLEMHAAPCSQMYAFVSDYVSGPDLWDSAQCQDRAVAMWKAIAARYANQNVIAGYDLLGESITSDAQLLALYQRITAAVRQVDPNHMLVYEGNYMARTFTLFTAPLDPNEMISFHDYAWAFPGQDFSVRLAAYDAAAQRLNVPLYAGEFGESTYSDAQRYVTDMNNDPLVAAWTYWTWKQNPGFSSPQNIHESAAAAKLIDWVNNTSRPQPTATEAAQGISDFINEVRFETTLPDAYLVDLLSAPMPTGAAPDAPAPATARVAPTSGTGAKPAPVKRPSPRRRSSACRSTAPAPRKQSRKKHATVRALRCGSSRPAHQAARKHRARRRS